MHRRLNVSNGAGGITGVKRARFDAHLDSCEICAKPESGPGTILCLTAQSLWRGVVQAALRAQGTVTK